MKIIALVFFLVVSLAIVESKTLWHQLEDYSFEKYVKEFQKEYSNEEYKLREAIFEANLKEIRTHNKDETNTWKKGVNHLTDTSHQEFKKLLGVKKGLLHAPKSQYRTEYKAPIIDLNGLPSEVDWRQKGVVSSVKDQGRCGSCWAFATAETVESHFAISSGFLTDLSEQQILDCTPNPNHCGGTGGCGGGTADLAFAQMIKQGGLASEWTYPYISYTGNNYPCRNSSITFFAKISSYVSLPTNQYEPIMKAVAEKGPLIVNVDASSWKHYESGVYDGCKGPTSDIDHLVQLVGYGTDSKHGDYWLVRNSWNPSWGEKGYIRLKRSSKVTCQVDNTPEDGTGCDNGPPEINVCGECGILYDASYPTF